MKYIRIVTILLFTVFNLIGCGGSGSSTDSQSSPISNLEFKFFPPGFFVAGYREEFDFTGTRQRTDTNEQIDTFTNASVIVTQPEGVYNLTSVIPILDIGEIGFSNGTTTPVSVTQNYTLFANDRRYIGDTTILFGITTTTTATSTSPIPETVNIGDSGEVGRYQDSFGQLIVITWNIEDAGNDQAQLIWTTRTRSAVDNSLLVEREDMSIIDVNGNRLSKSARIDFFNLVPNLLDNWIGVKVP